MDTTGTPARNRHELAAVLVVAQRDVTKFYRDRARLVVSLAFPLIIIAGLGGVLEPVLGRIAGLDAVTFAFTGVLAATLFQSAAMGIISLVEDRETDFSRELFVAPVHRFTIVAGKVLGESTVALCQGAAVVIVAPLLGVRLTLAQLAVLLPASVACCLVGATFGLVTLVALSNRRSAQHVFNVLMLPQFALGGILAPLHGLSPVLDVLSHAMPLRYAADLLRALFYAGTPSYTAAVSGNPAVDGVLVAGLSATFLAVGTVAFVHVERRR
ncbi:MAG: ABC transporter permease [Candidatus Dormibacteria bacterium]